MVVIRWFVLNRFAGRLFVARFAHKDFRRSLILTGLQFAWRAIRLVAGTAMKTPLMVLAAVVASRILRVARLYRSRFRSSLTRPPPPGVLPLGFHRGELSSAKSIVLLTEFQVVIFKILGV